MSDPARFAALMLLAAPLAGCAIGPNYERPEVAEPEAYRGQVGPAEAASLADLPWWEIFSDPALQELPSNRRAPASPEPFPNLVKCSVALFKQASAFCGWPVMRNVFPSCP